ncbi:MAG: GNAT family N-acetyltransferase, partial [Candidatus Marsarchaeota archaeon]|nr:GNAT family N-acetyltransferase [Candidatus Marsarchaeota archaeon]
NFHDKQTVGVLPSHRAQGAASKLIGFLLARIQEMGPALTYAWISLANASSIRAFQRNGFHLVNIRVKGTKPEGLFLRRPD